MIYTVTESDLMTQSFQSLTTTLHTSLDEARAEFLDGTPFDTWEELQGFSKRLNRWEPGDDYGQYLTDEDLAKAPGWREGSPMTVRVDETSALWVDGTLDGVSLSLEQHEV